MISFGQSEKQGKYELPVCIMLINGCVSSCSGFLPLLRMYGQIHHSWPIRNHYLVLRWPQCWSLIKQLSGWKMNLVSNSTLVDEMNFSSFHDVLRLLKNKHLVLWHVIRSPYCFRFTLNLIPKWVDSLTQMNFSHFACHISLIADMHVIILNVSGQNWQNRGLKCR